VGERNVTIVRVNHTCINTATTIDGRGPPPCEACAETLTCLACGARGIGIGFKHECDPLAARAERAAVVTWLRAQAVPVPHAVRATETTVQMLATAIENGEHLKVSAKNSGDLSLIEEARRLEDGPLTELKEARAALCEMSSLLQSQGVKEWRMTSGSRASLARAIRDEVKSSAR
jgi:hypothetical protein